MRPPQMASRPQPKPRYMPPGYIWAISGTWSNGSLLLTSASLVSLCSSTRRLCQPTIGSVDRACSRGPHPAPLVVYKFCRPQTSYRSQHGMPTAFAGQHATSEWWSDCVPYSCHRAPSSHCNRRRCSHGQLEHCRVIAADLTTWVMTSVCQPFHSVPRLETCKICIIYRPQCTIVGRSSALDTLPVSKVSFIFSIEFWFPEPTQFQPTAEGQFKQRPDGDASGSAVPPRHAPQSSGSLAGRLPSSVYSTPASAPIAHTVQGDQASQPRVTSDLAHSCRTTLLCWRVAYPAV